ncbi:hypothetical protein PG996_003015 [Apiospora saccharicola]|uniref:Autophagy-related protein 16 domain-containing protein n=1 Tax=Apiospora saccharicola TaxID=335842 RepID=A0ABR1W016_9PEZI
MLPPPSSAPWKKQNPGLAWRDTWLDEEKARTAALDADLALKQDQVTSLTENLQSVTESRDSKEAELLALKRELASQGGRIKEFEAQNASLQDSVASRAKQIVSLDNQIILWETRTESLQENVKVLGNGAARYQGKNNE